MVRNPWDASQFDEYFRRGRDGQTGYKAAGYTRCSYSQRFVVSEDDANLKTNTRSAPYQPLV